MRPQLHPHVALVATCAAAGILIAACSGGQHDAEPPAPSDGAVTRTGIVRYNPIEGGFWYVESFRPGGPPDQPRPAVIETEALVDLVAGIPVELRIDGVVVTVTYHDIEDQPSIIMFGNQVRIRSIRVLQPPQAGPASG